MQKEYKNTHTKGISLLPEGKAAEEVLWHFIFAALGALLSGAELLFGVRPFGIALCAAASK